MTAVAKDSQLEPTVFVVDDDPAARESVIALARSKNVKAEGYASAEEFMAAYDSARPGCLVTDVMMPGSTGLELQKQLTQAGCLLPVIVITAFADVPMAVKAVQDGALTLLQKPCLNQELWASVQLALARDAVVRKRRRHGDEIRRRMALLSPDEHAVMDKVISGKPNKVIATELQIGLRTVELRRAAVLSKLQAGSLAELVQLVIEAELTAPKTPAKR